MKKIILIALLLIVFLSQKSRFSALEVDKNLTRQNYLGSGLGKVYGNRFGIYYFTNTYPMLMKLESNFFSSLNNGFIYIPIFILLIYLGGKKYYEN